MAVRVQMTGMPEMVALFNGFGGAASALVAANNVWKTMLEYVKADSITLVIVEHNVSRAKSAQRCFSMEIEQSSEQAILTEVEI